MNCCPSCSDSFCASIRPTVSSVPPGGNGMIIRMGRLGQLSAFATPGANDPIASTAAASTAIHERAAFVRFIVLLRVLRRFVRPLQRAAAADDDVLSVDRAGAA